MRLQEKIARACVQILSLWVFQSIQSCLLYKIEHLEYVHAKEAVLWAREQRKHFDKINDNRVEKILTNNDRKV